MEYEAYKVRGYGFGLKKEITGVLGRYPTQEEAQKVDVVTEFILGFDHAME
ncbi:MULTISPECIES: hypothetical protein [Enterobacteriaceae]|uniref:hypothetical protein n=1 Tax=Enterobacteriaceae TaxID=543 RepID=UPI0013EF36A3|nr:MULTISPECIES: hypothetical protein [Enterobacteriaceae]